MRFLCTNCGYIYDESLGEESDGIDPGTCIEEMNEENHCPMCGESFDEFSPIEDEIIYAMDDNNLTEVEREHIPVVMHQDSEKVEVSVGGDDMHPSGPDHRVTAMYLVDDEGHIIEEVFIMPEEDPVAEFDVSGLELFEIRASCNRHGLWSTGMLEGK